MNLKKHYDTLWDRSKKEITDNISPIDEKINSQNDNRRGITLLARINNDVLNNIRDFLNECKVIEPDQYYYRDSDVHITVMSIITCYEGFRLGSINIDDYSKIIKKSLENIRSFNIDLKGITAAGSSVMIQGFPSNDNINVIRDNLRNHFKSSNLEHSIDKRYPIKTAHSTIIRFKNELKNPKNFIKLLEKYRDYHFSKTKVDRLELVFNDWYQRKENSKMLRELTLL